MRSVKRQNSDRLSSNAKTSAKSKITRLGMKPGQSDPGVLGGSSADRYSELLNG